MEWDKRKRLIIRLFTALFVVSVSSAVISGGIINGFGLFGEVKASVALEEEKKQEKETAAKKEKAAYVREINGFNIWFEVFCILVCLIFAVYMIKLPRGRTMVTLKVRMDD